MEHPPSCSWLLVAASSVLTVPAITIEQNGIAQTPKVVGATDECQVTNQRLFVVAAGRHRSPLVLLPTYPYLFTLAASRHVRLAITCRLRQNCCRAERFLLATLSPFHATPPPPSRSRLRKKCCDRSGSNAHVVLRPRPWTARRTLVLHRSPYPPHTIQRTGRAECHAHRRTCSAQRWARGLGSASTRSHGPGCSCTHPMCRFARAAASNSAVDWSRPAPAGRYKGAWTRVVKRGEVTARTRETPALVRHQTRWPGHLREHSVVAPSLRSFSYLTGPSRGSSCQSASAVSHSLSFLLCYR
jgi:hypothetical protein